MPDNTVSALFDTGEALKRCSKCKASKPYSEFDLCYDKRIAGKPKWKSWCQTCLRAYVSAYYKTPHGIAKRKAYMLTAKHKTYSRMKRLKLCYSMTTEQYDGLLEKQNGVCAICRQAETMMDKRTGQLKRLAIDHDHETGNVRGLLCARCNRAIGFLKDSVDLVRSALAYLEEWS